MYIDLEVKYGAPETIRNLFERSISLGLKPKKMKFFFKKYIHYEGVHGTPESVENVKSKANQYVEELLRSQEDKK